jgi:DHA1 family bicyclomycin/chloramphenicol resistance-like MFS transporter
MTKPQKYLGKGGTLLFLAIISAFPPLSTDLYLPALPQLVEYFSTTTVKVNMTLSFFFIFYASGLLFWGPLSEKFGRKPVLLTGHVVYIAASFICTLAQEVDHLIIARMLQAFGGSGITVVAMAAVKDIFVGRERERMMAAVMSMVAIAPMVAPMIGAVLLKVASWQMVFIFLAVFGCFSLVLSFFFQECLQEKYTGSIVRSWGRLFVVLKNPGFSLLLGIFSLTSISFMAYLAAASFVYVNHFGLSEQQFSFFFAANVIFGMVGPMTYMRLSKHFSTTSLITASFALTVLCGLLIGTVGCFSPWLFLLLIAPSTLANMIMRVPSTNLMLEQQERDAGSAAALIQFSAMFLGTAGMFLVSLRPEHMVESIGWIQLVVGLIGGVVWLMVRKCSFIQDKLPKN